MSEYEYSESMMVANMFAVQLLAGTLNHHVCVNEDAAVFTEVHRHDDCFSTNVITQLRLVFYGMQVSKLVPSKIGKDPLMGDRGESRRVLVYAKDSVGKERKVAMLRVIRYLRSDGDWRPWFVDDVVVYPTDGEEINLFPEQTDNMCGQVWGQILPN